MRCLGVQSSGPPGFFYSIPYRQHPPYRRGYAATQVFLFFITFQPRRSSSLTLTVTRSSYQSKKSHLRIERPSPTFLSLGSSSCGRRLNIRQDDQKKRLWCCACRICGRSVYESSYGRDEHQLMLFTRSLRNDDIKRGDTPLDQLGQGNGTDPLCPASS